MKQICKFDSKPATINNGGFKKGHWIVWLNLDVTEIVPAEGTSERFQCISDRLVLPDNSITGFLSVVDSGHLAVATPQEIIAILRYFNAEEDVEGWRGILSRQIEGYDQSEKVNQFYLGDIPMWLDKSTRVGLVNSLTVEKEAGRTTSVLWAGTQKITIPVETGLQLLAALELYAIDCFGVTASHQAFVENAQSVEELKAFDLGADYPEIPRFKF